MSRSHVATLALALLFAGCHHEATIPETSADAEPLRWLDHADAIADFIDHVERQHDLRFASVYAFSASGAIGLDETREVKQLLQRYGERHIEGTTDIITSAEQRRLLQKASDYVKQYNILLLRYLREHPNA
jgi:hypothetical protein